MVAGCAATTAGVLRSSCGESSRAGAAPAASIHGARTSTAGSDSSTPVRSMMAAPACCAGRQKRSVSCAVPAKKAKSTPSKESAPIFCTTEMSSPAEVSRPATPSSSSRVIWLAASGDSVSASFSSLPAMDDAPTMATRVVADGGRRVPFSRVLVRLRISQSVFHSTQRSKSARMH
jgi:hypothetical protein